MEALAMPQVGCKEKTMANSNKARIPLSLVTGFLGSGKTTFLKHVAARQAGRRLVYLVNDFSALDVDGAILSEIGPNVVSVPGGSIFCKCLVGDFIDHLVRIAQQFRSPDQLIDGLIIEASGIADPKVVADMLRQTKLDRVYELARIVAVADPGSFHKLLATLPNIRSQIEAADTVLLNKIDLFDEPGIAATEAAIREINPRVRILRTLRAAADIDMFDAQPPRDLHGEYAGCADPHYERFSVTFSKPVDMTKLQVALTSLTDRLYRAKGFVPTPDGTIYLDFSTAGLSANGCHMLPGTEPGLAIIARVGGGDVIDMFIGRVLGGAFDAK
jgi:G3E family GTPase